jgi:tRNA1(Val) A37 N6-methylase TrmN6
VKPRAGEPANLFLAELVLAKHDVRTLKLPALVLFKRAGEYTREAETIFSGRPYC